MLLDTETHLRLDEAFRMVNYVFHHSDRLTEERRAAILIRRGVDYYAESVQGIKHLKATAIQVMLASKPVKFLAVYLSPSRSLFASDLSACLDGSYPIFMAGDLKAKHVDWNSKLITTRDRLLRDYSSLIYGPNTPTAISYNSFATPDALDIDTTKDLVTLVYLTTCSAMSSDLLPILIDTRCR